MDRALDLKPEVTQGCGFESRLRQEVHDCSPGAAQSAAHCSKCVHREHISLLIILCIIVYVTNKAHPSLICIVTFTPHDRKCTSHDQLCRYIPTCVDKCWNHVWSRTVSRLLSRFKVLYYSSHTQSYKYNQ